MLDHETMRRRLGIFAFGLMLLLIAALGVKGVTDFQADNEERPLERAKDDEPAPTLRLRREAQNHASGEVLDQTKESGPDLVLLEDPRLELLILNPEGEGMASAEVTWLDPRRASQADEELFEDLAATGKLEGSQLPLKRGLSDERGHLLIAEFEGRLHVWVQVPGYRLESGAVELEHRAFKLGPAIITMERALDILVQVVGPEGAEISGIPVAVFQERLAYHLSQSDSPRKIAHRLCRSFTDDLGRAILQLSTATAAQNSDLFVALDFPQDQANKVRFHPRFKTQEALRLELPALARIQIACSKADQELLSAKTRLRLLGRNPAMDPCPVGEVFGHQIEPGLIEFWPVGLGAKLQIAVEGANKEIVEPWIDEATRGTFQGPTRVGEILRIELPQRRADHLFHFRLLDARGRPVISERLLWEHLAGLDDFNRSPELIRVDEKGRGSFRLSRHLNSSQADSKERAVIKIRREEPQFGGFEDFAACVQVRLPGGPWPAEVDLGDLRLEEGNLLASGRVLNAAGEALAFASLAWGSRYEATELPWNDRPELHCDAVGSFEIRERVELGEETVGEEELCLWAWAPGYFPQRLATSELPAEDLEFRLEPAVTLEIRMICDPGINRNDLVLQVSGPALDAWRMDPSLGIGQRSPLSLEFGVESRLRIQALDQGLLRLSLRYRHDTSIEFLEETITIPESAHGGLQLATLDLKGRIDFMVLQVKDENGVPPEQAKVRWWESREDGSSWATEINFDSFGRTKIPRVPATSELVILADGYLAHHLSGFSHPSPMVLQPAPKLAIQVSLDGVEVKAGLFQVEFENEITGLTRYLIREPFPGMTLPEAGSYKVRLRSPNKLEAVLDKDLRYLGTESELILDFQSPKKD